HGLIPENAGQLEVFGDLGAFRVPDLKQVTSLSSLSFTGKGNNPFLLLFGKAAGKLLQTKPVLSKNLCVGCGVCAGICPAKAIEIKEKKAVIDRRKCIRCFCCQEFCPKSAMKVRRTPVAALFHKENKKRKG
ncbi:MAG: 4Fe-4S binding protein, partial [Clostridia bacterium]|nr:4Fe-4S binding protein [Clostridia bacterium]